MYSKIKRLKTIELEYEAPTISQFFERKKDIVSFGEDEENQEKLSQFINTLNGAEGNRFDVHFYF